MRFFDLNTLSVTYWAFIVGGGVSLLTLSCVYLSLRKKPENKKLALISLGSFVVLLTVMVFGLFRL